MAPDLLDRNAIDAGLDTLHGEWSGDTTKLSRAIEFADFRTAVEFITRLAPRCEELDHHPDQTLRWRTVGIEVATHSAGGVTERDFALARIIDEIAAGLPIA
jgi:4a-hydroxytetrahydrobiopterin dehydratase